MKVSSQLLRDKGACPEQVALFKKHFGTKPVSVTQTRCVKYAHMFNFDWAAEHLLSSAAFRAYNEARAPAGRAYNEACATAFTAYNEACAIAGRASNEECAMAGMAYTEACAPALKAYGEACAPADRVFNEALAIAFFEASKMELAS